MPNCASGVGGGSLPASSCGEPDSENSVDPVATLRRRHPYGHKRFVPITLREVALHSEKNHDYSYGGPALGNFDRVAALLAQYPNLKLSDRRVIALVYVLKQLDAVLWMLNSGHEAHVEGMEGRLQDISVYAKLVMCMISDDAEDRVRAFMANDPLGRPPAGTPLNWENEQ